MAVRKTGTRKTATGKTTKKPPSKPASKSTGNRVPKSAAFWTFLIIVIIIAFFMLLPKIKKLNLTAKTTETEQRTEEDERTGNREQGTDERKEKKEEGKKEDAGKAREEGKEKKEEGTEGKKQQTEKPEVPAVKPQEQPEKKPQAEKPAAPVSTSPVKPVETRDRSIYLIQKSTMVLVKVNRKLNVSNTPLLDSVNALLAGPTPDEIMRDMESLVPEGSRLLSARVDGSTAVLDFNQEFRYNTRGSEGCAAQIKQIVWTATEFPNVQNVQFLIEGQRVDFLSEGVVVKNPISR